MKKLILITVLVIILSTAITISYYTLVKKPQSISNIAKGASAQSEINSQDDWQAGIPLSNNITAEVGGDIVINNKTAVETKIDASTATITASESDGTKNNSIDGNLSTFWGPIPGLDNSLIFDFGTTKVIKKIKVNFHDCNTMPLECVYIATSSNGSDWNFEASFMTCPAADELLETSFPSDVPARYWKFHASNVNNWIGGGNFNEIEFYTGTATATHISAPTQITNANLYQWQTFSPTYTKPANTDISFKFRTSADGATWNSWTDSQSVASGGSLTLTPLVASWSGTEENPGTFYKYIQVESTLTSTDGVSTPTLSDYTIGYHTNIAPSKPVVGTVKIGN